MVPPFLHPFGVLLDQLVALQLRWPLVPLPDGEFILNEHAFLIRDAIPRLRRETDAVTQRVPMHPLERPMQAPHPILPPGAVGALRVFEEPVQRHVATAQEIRAAIQHRAARLMVEAKLPHAKTSAQGVRAGARFQLVQEGILWRPQPAMANRETHFHSLLGVAVEHDWFGEALAGEPTRARLAHLEAQLRGGLRAGVAHDRLHANSLAGNLGRNLHADDVRRPG